MSVIVVNKEQITKAQLNTSVSKQMYTFPKSVRFPPKKSAYSFLKFLEAQQCFMIFQV